MKDEELLEVDIDELPAQVRAKLYKKAYQAMARKYASAGDSAKSEEEREKLSSLHEEGKGERPKVPVEDDDLPEELKDEGDEKKKKKNEKKRA
jgi:hypothetical protein